MAYMRPTPRKSLNKFLPFLSLALLGLFFAYVEQARRSECRIAMHAVETAAFFGSTPTQDGGARLARWREPPGVEIVDLRKNAENDDSTAMSLARVREKSGLALPLVGAGEARVRIILVDEGDRNDLADALERSGGEAVAAFSRAIRASANDCLAWAWKNADDEIFASSIVAGGPEPEAPQQCLHAAIFEALGLIQTRRAPPASFLNPRHGPPGPSAIDWSALRLLYLDEVRPGMTREAFRDAVNNAC